MARRTYTSPSVCRLCGQVPFPRFFIRQNAVLREAGDIRTAQRSLRASKVLLPNKKRVFSPRIQMKGTSYQNNSRESLKSPIRRRGFSLEIREGSAPFPAGKCSPMPEDPAQFVCSHGGDCGPCGQPPPPPLSAGPVGSPPLPPPRRLPCGCGRRSPPSPSPSVSPPPPEGSRTGWRSRCSWSPGPRQRWLRGLVRRRQEWADDPVRDRVTSARNVAEKWFPKV